MQRYPAGAAISTATVFDRAERLAYVTTLEGRVLAFQPGLLLGLGKPFTQPEAAWAHADQHMGAIHTVPDVLKGAAAGPQSLTASTADGLSPTTAQCRTQLVPVPPLPWHGVAEAPTQHEPHSTGLAEMRRAAAQGWGVDQDRLRSGGSADLGSHAAGHASCASHTGGSEAAQPGPSFSKGGRPGGMFLMWERPLATPVLSTPTVDETHGLLIVALLDGSVCAFGPRGEHPALQMDWLQQAGTSCKQAESWSQVCHATYHHDFM